MFSFATRVGALAIVALLASPSAGKRLTAGPSLPPSSPPPAAQEGATSFHVEVRAREHSNRLTSLASQECALVRRTLEVPLASLKDPSQAVDVVQATLQKAFAGRVRQDPDVVRYKAVWCPEIKAFKIKCCVIVVFEVMLENSIVVPVEIGTRL